MARTCIANLYLRARCRGDRALPLQLDLGPGGALERGRALAAVAELFELDELAVRAESFPRVLVRQIERVGRVGLDVEALANAVERRAFGRHPADVANQAAQLARRHQLPVRRAGRCRDAFVDERAA